MKYVKVHSGSAHVKGKARTYRYYVASLFTPVADGGGVRLVNSGEHVGPFRSRAKTEREGKQFASQHGAEFVEGYGSLHNHRLDSPLAQVAQLVAECEG